MTSRWIDRVGISVDRSADVSIGVQLAWGLGGAIRSGALTPGDRLPPLRILAAELGVNPNTLRAVYARLESAGLIETRHGSGTFVTSAVATRDLAGLVADAAQAARDAGLEPRELAAALYFAPTATPPSETDADRRRSLRQEIAVLERVLSGLGARPAPREAVSQGPQLLSVAQLRATRDDLVARIGAATRPPPPEPEAKRKPAREAKVKAKARPRPRLGPATA